MDPKRIIVGITGASGAPYAKRLLERLAQAECEIHLVASALGRRLLSDECGIKRLDADELTVSEFAYGPSERGANPHVHYNHADAFLVVDGEFTFAFRDGSLAGPAGSLFLFPPGVVHGFDNDSAANARCFNLHRPAGGFADYLRGQNPDFDQHDPPADGGVDPAAVVAVRLSQ